jgi:hypothetical protein
LLYIASLRLRILFYDYSATVEESKQLVSKFYTSCASSLGSLLHLSMTTTDIFFAVNQLAKFTRKPGKTYFEDLIHLS